MSADAQPTLRTRSRVAAYVIRDYLLDPKVVRDDDVPWRPEAMTAAWLTAVLCREAPGAEVVDVEVSGGTQGSTVRRAVSLTYNDAGTEAGLPDHLFAKSTPSLLTRLSSGFAAQAESRFHRTLRAELDIEAPWMIHASVDKETKRSIQLFLDLVHQKQTTFFTYETDTTRLDAEQAVATLGTLHGQYYDSPRFGQDLQWLNGYEDFLRAGERDGIRVGHDAAMLKCEDVVPAPVFARREEIWPQLKRSLSAHQDEPRTVIHSDVHLGNWYRTGAGVVGLGDWQCICTGHWAHDLAYTVSTLLPVEDRRAAEGDLLARYVERLHEAGGPKVSIDHAWLRYRQQMFAALLMWTPTLVHPPTMPDMQPEAMSRLMIHRITTAIDDLDSLGSFEG